MKMHVLLIAAVAAVVPWMEEPVRADGTAPAKPAARGAAQKADAPAVKPGARVDAAAAEKARQAAERTAIEKSRMIAAREDQAAEKARLLAARQEQQKLLEQQKLAERANALKERPDALKIKPDVARDLPKVKPEGVNVIKEKPEATRDAVKVTPEAAGDLNKVKPDALRDAAKLKPDAPAKPGAAEKIDKREANQQKRIEQGVKKGQLTPAETEKLQGLEQNILTLEETFKTDGKLTRGEAQQLRTAMHEASLQIWAERHDTEGKQMPAVRLGKDVFAKDELTAKIESGEMTRAQAREFLGEFRRLANIKRRLATDVLSETERAQLQAQYNELLSKYFVVK